MPQTRIRPIIAHDLPKVTEMIRALANHHQDNAQIDAETLARDALGPTPWITVLVAQADTDLLGYTALCPLVQLQCGVRGMDMHHLFVDAAHRGQGIGTALIDAALAQVRSVGGRYMTVGIHPAMQSTGRFYRAAGFEDLAPPGPRFRIRW